MATKSAGENWICNHFTYGSLWLYLLIFAKDLYQPGRPSWVPHRPKSSIPETPEACPRDYLEQEFYFLRDTLAAEASSTGCWVHSGENIYAEEFGLWAQALEEVLGSCLRWSVLCTTLSVFPQSKYHPRYNCTYTASAISKVLITPAKILLGSYCSSVGDNLHLYKPVTEVYLKPRAFRLANWGHYIEKWYMYYLIQVFPTWEIRKQA